MTVRRGCRLLDLLAVQLLILFSDVSFDFLDIDPSILMIAVSRGVDDSKRPLLLLILGTQLDRLAFFNRCLLYTSPSPRDQRGSRMPSSA